MDIIKAATARYGVIAAFFLYMYILLCYDPRPGALLLIHYGGTV